MNQPMIRGAGEEPREPGAAGAPEAETGRPGALPSGHETAGGAPAPRLTAGGRLSALELEPLERRQGTHPGDAYVRRAHPDAARFRRVGPGRLEALAAGPAPGAPLGRALGGLKRALLGAPLSTAAAAHERLNQWQALAVLSSDALSSVAYATEAVLGALLVAGAGALGWNLWVSGAIALLIGVLVFSYRQTIFAYPSGGGSYIVASANLGPVAGLIAAGSLLTDYVLTVAVSVSAGVVAIYSLAPQLLAYRVPLCLAALAVILVLNLRGARSAGTAFAIPTFTFLALVFGMLGFGLAQILTGGLAPVGAIRDVIPAGSGTQVVGLALLLSAFSSGCTALTGIEAISDGVPAFRPPEARHAASTMVSLGLLLGSMFLGISFLADQVGARPSASESVLSQVGRAVFRPLDGLSPGGANLAWTLLQWATALILVLAANTSFADFPRLGFFLARDRYLPHLFAQRGDRLAFTVGILTLAALSAGLIVAFNGDTTALLPLYAIGVFSSFTLSQAGMVARWRRLRTPGWRRSALINGVGAATTLLVLLILCWTKFGEGQTLFTLGGLRVNAGAWIVIALVPLLALGFRAIRRHYDRVSAALSLAGVDPAAGRAAAAGIAWPLGAAAGAPPRRLTHLLIMPIAGVNQVTLRTLAYARSLTPEVVAVHVAADEDAAEVAALEARWRAWAPGVPLVIVESPYRTLFGPLLGYIDALQRQQPDRVLTVLLPEFVVAHPWEYLLHNQSALRLKAALLFRPGLAVLNVPYHIGRTA
jgi:amino acid transporter